MSFWQRLRPMVSVSIRFLRISYLEAKSEYQGTTLGLAWVPLSTLIFTLMLSFVFHHSDAGDHVNFFFYVLSGYVLWNFISESIGGSVDIIQKRLEFSVHNNLSLHGLFLKVLSDRIFLFSLNLILLFACCIAINRNLIGINTLLFFPFFLLVLTCSLSISYIVNLLTIFVPDAATLVKTGVRFIFFASPVFWVAGPNDGIRKLLVTYNPASYLLSLSRQVFGVERLSGQEWLISLAFAAVLSVSAAFAYRQSESFVRNLK